MVDPREGMRAKLTATEPVLQHRNSWWRIAGASSEDDHKSHVRSVVVSERHVLAHDSDDRLCLWSLATGRPVWWQNGVARAGAIGQAYCLAGVKQSRSVSSNS